jgi:hypothetical protein
MANYNSLKNAGLTKPSANVSLGSDTSRYTDIFLSGNVNIAGTSLTSTNAITPRIATIAYVGNDTAAAPAGGQTITLNGSGFVSSSVYVGGTIVASVSVVNSTQLTFVAPAKTAGSYSLNVVNSDGASATFIPGIQYSGIPAWSTTAGSLGSINATSSVNLTVAATSDSTVSYSITSGSLPSGVTLNSSTGAITGTAPNVGSTTTYNFTVRATDSENQDTDRNFSITITAATMVEYLVVAGGGSGASRTIGGGGGGGGLLNSTLAITPGTPYTVTVGGGAAGATSVDTPGARGTSSVFGSITAMGGGGGVGNYNSQPASGGKDGGSGGGGSTASYAGGLGIYSGSSYLSQTRQGYDGGAGFGGAGNGQGGGGGGAGAVGGTGTSGVAGSGGAGLYVSQFTNAGSPSGYYGGGGGGSSEYVNGTGGGTGGGGIPGAGATTGSGTANTGGGGAAGRGSGTAQNGGSGGSGIVIVRYADSYAAAASTTGSPTYTTPAGYRVYTFTSSGSITF